MSKEEVMGGSSRRSFDDIVVTYGVSLTWRVDFVRFSRLPLLDRSQLAYLV